MKILNTPLFNELSSQARSNPRLRQNLNLHESYDEPCQRLLNAIEPGSYLRPHRHLADPKPETFVAIRGRIVLVIFDGAGTIEKTVFFGPGENSSGVDLPAGVWHTVVGLEGGSVFFETKPGPFNPICEEDRAPWAPEEGTAEAATYLERLEDLIRSIEKNR